MVYNNVQTGVFIVIFLTDGNLLISMGTNLTICLYKPVFHKGQFYRTTFVFDLY